MAKYSLKINGKTQQIDVCKQKCNAIPTKKTNNIVPQIPKSITIPLKIEYTFDSIFS